MLIFPLCRGEYSYIGQVSDFLRKYKKHKNLLTKLLIYSIILFLVHDASEAQKGISDVPKVLPSIMVETPLPPQHTQNGRNGAGMNL